jgi:ribose/xylose/arabinose/galactoside ABC-type transport system permease subunit
MPRPRWISDVVSAAVCAGLFFILLVFFVVRFEALRTGAAFEQVLVTTAAIGLPALGVTLVMAAGRADLSGAMVAGLVGTMVAKLVMGGTPGLVAVVAALIVGGLVGLGNGVLSAISRPASYLLTLGVGGCCQLVGFLLTNGLMLQTGPLVGVAGAIPMLAVVAVVLTGLVVLGILLTPAGTWLRGAAVEPGNLFLHPHGLGVLAVTAAYVVSGVLAGLTGVIEGIRVGTVSPQSFSGFEIPILAAAVLGGSSVHGGTGNAYGTVLAALALGVLYVGLAVSGVNGFVASGVVAVLLVLGVLWDELRFRIWASAAGAPGS